MFARLSVFQGPPDRTAEGIRVARKEILPIARQQPGFRGIYLLHDPVSGRSLSLTLWETQEDMVTSEESAQRARSTSTQVSGDAVVSVERYEVALSELVDSPPETQA
jgi:heme-degrading monooxygenase HmoA